MGKKKYFTDEERKAARSETYKRYYRKNKEKRKECNAKKMAAWYSTQRGRATVLLNNYKREDKKYNRGECTITADWIIGHIFTHPCTHCGESDWRKLGCNRIDNSLPHTPDNVEPCCKRCNEKMGALEKAKQVFQYTLDGELINVWESTQECNRCGYGQSAVAACCRGETKTYKGYIWSYEPL